MKIDFSQVYSRKQVLDSTIAHAENDANQHDNRVMNSNSSDSNVDTSVVGNDLAHDIESINHYYFSSGDYFVKSNQGFISIAYFYRQPLIKQIKSELHTLAQEAGQNSESISHLANLAQRILVNVKKLVNYLPIFKPFQDKAQNKLKSVAKASKFSSLFKKHLISSQDVKSLEQSLNQVNYRHIQKLTQKVSALIERHKEYHHNKN